jgi:lambda family phage minor tail protein L
MTPKKINQEILSLEPSVQICFYQLYIINEGPMFFHSGENGINKKLIFQGQEYDYIPIEASGFTLNADGTLPRPKLRISNVNGQMSTISRHFKDFIGSKLIRIRTFLKFLDAENFPDNINPHGTPDPEAKLSNDEYIVNIKTVENNELIEYELRSPLDLEKATIPGRRVMPNHCAWTYRSKDGCGYNDWPIADVHDTKFSEGYLGESSLLDMGYWNRDSFYKKGDWVRVPKGEGSLGSKALKVFVCINDGVRSNPLTDKTNWVQDMCSGNLTGCRLRFGNGGNHFIEKYTEKQEGEKQNEEDRFAVGKGLPFGGFPGVDRYRF